MKSTANFDRVARVYRWAEYLALGPLLQRTRVHFLPQLAACRRALVLGDGDGRFLARLMQQNPELEATAVDSSTAMLRLLRQRCDRYEAESFAEGRRQASCTATRLQTIQADALGITPPPDVDLIVTHFFLDCLSQSEVDRLTQTLAAPAQPGTLWLLSDFRVPATGPLRLIASVYIRGLYFSFRILTGLRVHCLPDPQTALAHADFHRIASHRRLGGILYTELWQRGRATLGGDTIVADADMIDLDTQQPAPYPRHHPLQDALPDPEPAAPSLAGPDLGVFGHEPATKLNSGTNQK